MVFHEGKIDLSAGQVVWAQSWSGETTPGCTFCNGAGCILCKIFDLPDVTSAVCGYCGTSGCRTSNHICNLCFTLGCTGAYQTFPCCTVPYCLGLHCNTDNPPSDCEDGNERCINGHCSCSGPCPNCNVCGCNGECLNPPEPPSCEGTECPICHGYKSSGGGAARMKRMNTNANSSCKPCICPLPPDCNKAMQGIGQLENFFSDASDALTTNLNSMNTYAATSTNEWGTSYVYDPDNGWFPKPLVTDNSPTGVIVEISQNTGITSHTHTDAADVTGPSALDLQTLEGRQDWMTQHGGTNYLGEYIVSKSGDGTVGYFLYITDQDAAAVFLQNYTNYVGADNNFLASSTFGKLYY